MRPAKAKTWSTESMSVLRWGITFRTNQHPDEILIGAGWWLPGGDRRRPSQWPGLFVTRREARLFAATLKDRADLHSPGAGWRYRAVPVRTTHVVIVPRVRSPQRSAKIAKRR